MNWGNKLLATFIVFAGGMGFLVYRSVTTQFELVEKDYYKQELRYQQKIDGAREVSNLSGTILLTQNEKGIHLQLPVEMKNRNLTGEVWFYCAYNEKKDKKFSLQTNTEAVQSFGLQEVEPGQYTVKINWKDGQTSYYSEKNLTVL